MRVRRAVLLLACFSLHCGTRSPVVGPDSGTPEPPDAGSLVADASVPDDAGLPEDGGTKDGGTVDGGTTDAGPADAGVDLDRDGLDDAFEASLASAYLPVLAVHPSDSCPRGGIVYRARKHPLDPSLVFIVYAHLFERDCGLTSHVGDDEVFAITVNPTVPAPQGITAIRAISHQGTVCQRTSSCGTCNGATACEQSGGRPIVYFSRDKHAAYVSLTSCGTLTCLDVCADGDRMGVPLVNAGEPNANLTNDLTDAGFITAANGWTEASLMHFDPWGGRDFGGAGSVTSDLTDPAFDTPACR